MSDTWDVIVIGGGPVGENAAQYAIAGSDRTAVIIESELVGGECPYWACMPSKALLLPGQVRDHAMAMPGVEVEERLGVGAVLDRRNRFTSAWDDAGQLSWADSIGVAVVRGQARLTGVRQVQVGNRTLTARRAVVLATGSAPNQPPIPGLAQARAWTSRDATAIRTVPASIMIIGGGVVACESATWLSSFGCTVTMAVRGDRLLTNTEPFAGERVADALAARGVKIIFGVEVTGVERAQVHDEATAPVGEPHGGPVTTTVQTSDGSAQAHRTDELLVSVGRHPAIDGLGLEAVGLNKIEVDDHLQVVGTNGEWLYACGDVSGRTPLTHMGKYQARVCGDVIAARADGRALDAARFSSTSDHNSVTQVVFTDPEVASVGPTEQQARDAGRTVSAVEIDIAVAGSSLFRDDFAGRAKLVVDDERDVLVGATFVGPGVAELLHAATIAVVGEVPLSSLWHAVPAYPTISEVWLRLLEERRSAER
ncbi:MAG: dihydrolipoyl dehydrogenase family protein [Propionibacteriaceae bacterium]